MMGVRMVFEVSGWYGGPPVGAEVCHAPWAMSRHRAGMALCVFDRRIASLRVDESEVLCKFMS